MRDSNTKFTKAMIDAMTLAEFEKLTPEQKIIIDISQYAETEEYSKFGLLTMMESVKKR